MCTDFSQFCNLILILILLFPQARDDKNYSVDTKPSVINVMLNGPWGTKNQAQGLSDPTMSAVPPSQTGSMAGGLANPYIPYPNMPPHPLWFGQLPIYNPSFPLLHPQQYMATLMTSVPPVPPVNYPMISEWLVLCDNHP
jgi:hypothetical protein